MKTTSHRFTILTAAFLSVVIVCSTPVEVLARYNAFYSMNDIEFADEFAEQVCKTDGVIATGGESVDAKFNLGSSAEERQGNLIRALMADYGLKDFQAAGVVGNFMLESGGANLPPNNNEGGIAGPPRFKGGYGWPQWTGGRQRSFIDFAIQKNYMASKSESATDAANYAYFKHEIATSEKAAMPALKKTTSVEQATETFMKKYERPGVPALSRRVENAKTALRNSTAATGTTNIAANCMAGNSSSGIVGNTAFPLIGTKAVVKNPDMFSNGTASLGGHPYTAFDILAAPGTPVAAFLTGKVTRIMNDRCGGRMISIYNESENLTISYLHMASQAEVKQGDTVSLGQRIGVVGSAGSGCGTPHLHIDAVKGTRRIGCSRKSCPEKNKALFVNIGKELYDTFQALPG
ncbi:hypothetical protein CR983_02850 [Candidatus Saccharibacteria bacterium]|nr:MAG: hypothetical protein CR983_02850 [Candidatus Saccharibacteria bacterium]